MKWNESGRFQYKQYVCLIVRATRSNSVFKYCVTKKMSHQYCWLCESDLLKGSMKAKRKKLHGDATKSTVKLLESISLDYLGIDLLFIL